MGLFEADTLAPVGAVPVAWYPTAVALSGSTLVVTNGKGIGTGPNTLTTGKELMTGTVSIVRWGLWKFVFRAFWQCILRRPKIAGLGPAREG